MLNCANVCTIQCLFCVNVQEHAHAGYLCLCGSSCQCDLFFRAHSCAGVGVTDSCLPSCV